MIMNSLARKYSEMEEGIKDQLQDLISAIDGYISQNELWDDIHVDVWNSPTWKVEDSDTFEIYHHTLGVRYDMALTDPYDDICDQSIDLYIPDEWDTMTTAAIVESIINESKIKFDREYESAMKDAERMAKELGMILVEDQSDEK